jgi:4a-hydroxytetrahydrobiopterin dehydratase
MSALTAPQLDSKLATLPEWRLEDGRLVRDFVFGDFRESMSFVQLIAALAEREQHHPDIDIRYNKVRLGLSTHDAGGITEKDLALARAIAGVL